MFDASLMNYLRKYVRALLQKKFGLLNRTTCWGTNFYPRARSLAMGVNGLSMAMVALIIG
jgi:hypothetical protein